MESSNKALAKAFFAVVVWGGSFVSTKIVLSEVSPIAIVWLRFLMGILLLGILAKIRGEWKLLEWRELRYFFILGFFGIAFHQWLQSHALLTSNATTAGWIVSVAPIFIAILGWIFLKERLGLLRWAGILLATFGVMLIVSNGNIANLFLGSFAAGDLLLLISALNWAVFSVISRKSLKENPPALMILYVMFFGWLLTSVEFFYGKHISELSNLTWSGWAHLTFLGVFCSGIAYVFWYDGLKVLPASRVGAMLYIEPLITVVFSAILIGEIMTIAGLLGGILILSGVALVNKPEPSLIAKEATA